jgi:hypothetical protein
MRIAWFFLLILLGLAGCVTVEHAPSAPKTTVVSPAPSSSAVTPAPFLAALTTP